MYSDLKTAVRIRLFGNSLLAGWLGLAGCSQPAAPSTKQAETGSSFALVTERLNMDIIRAQEIALREPDAPAPDQPVFYEYGTDADHKAYLFANLRAFRLDIKHRMDSLRIAGRVVRYDTIVTRPGTVGKMKVD